MGLIALLVAAILVSLFTLRLQWGGRPEVEQERSRPASTLQQVRDELEGASKNAEEQRRRTLEVLEP